MGKTRSATVKVRSLRQAEYAARMGKQENHIFFCRALENKG
jgi:hypothetical protein